MWTEISNNEVKDWDIVGWDKITNHIYWADDGDFWIIDEIFTSVIQKIHKDKPEEYNKDERYIPQTKKIKLNFKDKDEQEEIKKYFHFAYLKINLIEKRIEEEINDIQLDIEGEIYSQYKKLKREGKDNMDILVQLFENFIPNWKRKNPHYKSLARAFVLFYFDDCTIFEK